MPRKNKKKQRKEERRRAMQRVRQAKGWQPPPEIEFPDDELARDLLSFLPAYGGPLTEEQAAEILASSVLDSDELADEPEFSELYFHPMQAIDAYAELEEERAIDDEMLNALSEEEEDELFFELMEDLTRRVLSPQLQDAILEAMEAAWERVHKEGDQEKAGRLAAMLTLLQSKEGEEAWPQVGLVQAILHRSLEAGFEMARVFEGQEDADLSPREQWQLGTARRTEEQLEAVVARYPGLDAVLQQKDDHAWNEGLGALMEGELYVGFFSDEELEQAADLVNPEALGALGLPEEEWGQAGVQALRSYVSGLLTPERRAEMREHLLTLLEDEDLAGEYAPLLTATLYELEEENSDAALAVLTAAMLSELEDMAEYVLGEEDEGEDQD